MSELKILRVNDLLEYLQSKEYLEAPVVPISIPRAISYVNNPRALPDDVAIVMLYIENKMIAYRCLFSDDLYFEKESLHFSWISGSWVDPEYRRRGYSEKILTHIIDELKIPLLFSNYAPQSKALYDKSQMFSKVSIAEGKRFYFRFTFYDLLTPRGNFFKVISPLLMLFDAWLNLIFDTRLSYVKAKDPQSPCVETSLDDPEWPAFVAKMNTQNPMKRNLPEFSHACLFPWIKEKSIPDENDRKYYFSSFAKHFRYHFYKIYNSDKNICGFFILKIRDKTISVPYAFIKEEDALLVKSEIIRLVKKFKLNYFTVFNKEILTAFLHKKTPALFSKSMVRDFYALRTLKKCFSEDYVIYEGDGDNLFT